MERPQYIKQWFSLLLKKSGFHVESISLKNSQDWFYKNGSIQHRSGKFFKIVGIKWTSPSGSLREQPILQQEEFGILGFLVRPAKIGNEILLQAKIEPGNVGAIQLAPTCQATKSNTDQVHGGKLPPFVEYFYFKNKNIIYDVLQSEQGTRFLKKCNRNVVLFSKEKVVLSDFHRWFKMEEALDCLKYDFLVNTDARSVLVCAPWEKIIGRKPFSRYRTGFGAQLKKSIDFSSQDISFSRLKSELDLLRKKTEEPRRVNLEKIVGWQLSSTGIISKVDNFFQVRQIKAQIQNREVPEWDQPIIDSSCDGEITLFCGRKNKILHFLFQAKAEQGLYNKVELTPTITIEPGSNSSESIFRHWRGALRIQCRQSEEGGRFYQDANLFRIIDIGKVRQAPKNYYWLTLKDIRKLLDEEGWFTNEARSALSLILPWM